MSALNVTQAEANILIESLKMFSKVLESASGTIPSEVTALLEKLVPEVVVAEVVVTPVVEEAPAEAVAAFMDGVPHEQFTENAEETKDE